VLTKDLNHSVVARKLLALRAFAFLCPTDDLLLTGEI